MAAPWQTKKKQEVSDLKRIISTLEAAEACQWLFKKSVVDIDSLIYLFTVCVEKYRKSRDPGNTFRGTKRSSYRLSRTSTWRRGGWYLPYYAATPANWGLRWGLPFCWI